MMWISILFLVLSQALYVCSSPVMGPEQKRDSDILLGRLTAVYKRSEEASRDASRIMDRLVLRDLLINGITRETVGLEENDCRNEQGGNEGRLQRRSYDNDQGIDEMIAYRCLARTPLFRGQLAPVELMNRRDLGVVDGRVTIYYNLVPDATSYPHAMQLLGDIVVNISERVVAVGTDARASLEDVRATIHAVRGANQALRRSRRNREDTTDPDAGHRNMADTVRETQRRMGILLAAMQRRIMDEVRPPTVPRPNIPEGPRPAPRDPERPWGLFGSRSEL